LAPEEGTWDGVPVEAPHAGSTPAPVLRNKSISDIFLSIMDMSVLKACKNELDWDFRFMDCRVSLSDVIQCFALDIFLRAGRFPPSLSGTSHVLEDVWKNHVRPAFKDCMGVIRFRTIRNNFYITSTVAKSELTARFAALVRIGEFVTMDEKQKGFRGQSHCIKKVLSKKNDPVGHWTTQACVPLHETSLPYIIGLFPFDHCKKTGDASITMLSIWNWLLDLVKYDTMLHKPILCADSLYLDNAARTRLLKIGARYHCSVKPDRFQIISKHMKAKVQEMDSWVAMYNEPTGEVATYVWSSEKGVGKKMLITSALRKSAMTAHPVRTPPGWCEYKFMFSACDKYNKKIGHYDWPYRCSSWRTHLANIYMTHVVLNTVHLFRECHHGEQQDLHDTNLIKVLATQLYNRSRKNEFSWLNE
jgi:hypothetical protein